MESRKKTGFPILSRCLFLFVFLFSHMKNFLLQVPMPTPVPSFDNGGGTLDKLSQLLSEDEPIVCPTADKSSSKM